MTLTSPRIKPNCPNFSSGPCAKYPGWNMAHLQLESLGRSHRSVLGKSRLQLLLEQTRQILAIPDNYKIAIVPASDTGAVEMALWGALGNDVGVDVFAWESFGLGWLDDINNHLKITDVDVYQAPYGQLPALKHNPKRDCVFTYNGTTSGVKVPDTEWINKEREGITVCDATSAVFVEDLDWSKLDITTWSWQKALGGEGAHGMIVLSPRAVKRLETNRPQAALPKIFRLTKNGRLIDSIFEGATINTPSMLCVEDMLACYQWVNAIGGISALRARSYANYEVIRQWVKKTEWVDFLCPVEQIRSTTSICLTLKSQHVGKSMAKLCEQMDAGYDINAYRDAPPGLRIWGGPTVETADIQKLLPWLEWAYLTCQQKVSI